MTATATGAITATATNPTLLTRLRWQVLDTLVLARRNLAHVRQVPEKLIDVTLQPLMFVLLFAYVFGGVIHITGGSYHAYMLGGVAVQTAVFGIMGPGVSIATDLREGIVDRFRSLPMARSAYLLGHMLAELAAATLAIAVIAGAGLIVGWRIHTGLPDAVAGFSLLILISFTMVWIGTLLGVSARSPDAVQGVVFVLAFPLTFIASAYVPLAGLPQALRTIAEYNPVSAFAAAVRVLFGNPTAVPAHAAWPLHHPVPVTIAWCLTVLALAIPATLAAYRRRTTM
ncbi:MAG TPA: ABC transporter permease [Solirubrobacteraceae bacterium]|nr:ABC transporter permease [Solirubrobacteraceae bacterium]